MKINYLQSLGILIVLLLIINIGLFALNKIGEILFWAVIVFGAVFAYWILPKIKK